MNPLTAVRRATERRAESETGYRAAMIQARAAGHTYTEIGAAAGITPQGARYIIEGDPRQNGDKP